MSHETYKKGLQEISTIIKETIIKLSQVLKAAITEKLLEARRELFKKGGWGMFWQLRNFVPVA